ncbi:M23 family metallopeptidase [Saccharopolyspora shandongensis]|uniref:M23 family metallopeptidase n=1 Tax=Saccharopolyspora shandongensis TaxID=418495 RepID=UPI00342FC44C
MLEAGQAAVLQHANGVIKTYGHNGRNHVQPGQTVQRTNDHRSWQSWESSGPHLHFQIETDGQPTDPIAFYRGQSAPPLLRLINWRTASFLLVGPPTASIAIP